MFLLVVLACFSLFLCFLIWHCYTMLQGIENLKTDLESWDLGSSNAHVAQCFSLLSLPVSHCFSLFTPVPIGSHYSGIQAMQKQMPYLNSGDHFASDSCVAQCFSHHLTSYVAPLSDVLPEIRRMQRNFRECG